MSVKNIIKAVKSYLTVSVVILSLTGLSGCSKNSANSGKENNMNISAQDAKKIMDTQSDYIILDVRTKEEYDEGHIKDAVLIPDFELSGRASTELPDKDQLILVYCRSGRRSKNSAEELKALGYTNIREFGGIIDWPYETVK
ncbi:MAG: rhodanese-like domain-containing protein [Oscillospiraceae bacterium]|nr:rhodanese-like domain-containing protein [Oscillospiraceae bacterium]